MLGWGAFWGFVFFLYNILTDGWVDGGDNGDVIIFVIVVSIVLVIIMQIGDNK